MKHFSLFCHVLALVAASGCTPRTAHRTMEARLAAEPDSCLRHHTALYPSLAEAREYDSLERTSDRLLRALPLAPAIGPDTEYLSGWVLPCYSHVTVLHNKIRGGDFATTCKMKNRSNPLSVQPFATGHIA